MGPVGGRGFGGRVKFADGKTSSANVPHLNVWGFDISAAEFPQPKKTRVFGVNRPLKSESVAVLRGMNDFLKVIWINIMSNIICLIGYSRWEIMDWSTWLFRKNTSAPLPTSVDAGIIAGLGRNIFEWKEEHEIQCLQWLTQSPHLNPIQTQLNICQDVTDISERHMGQP